MSIPLARPLAEIWVDGFAIGQFANRYELRIRAAGDAVNSRAIRTMSRSLAYPGQIRANPFSLRIREISESTT